MTSSNEPGQPVGYMTPPAQGDSTFTSPNAQPKMNTMAVLALVFAFLFSPLAVVFGIVGRRQISRTGERGKGLATAGLILGVVGILLGILVVVLVSKGTPAMSKSTLESTISDKLAETSGLRPDSVSCSGDLAATVGVTDVCSVMLSGKSDAVKVEVTSVVDKRVVFKLTPG